MKAIKSAELRENMKDILDMVAGGETVIIPRPKNKNVVVVSEEEWNELIRAKKNAEYLAKIDKAFDDSHLGNVIVKTVDELDAMADG